MSKRRVLLRFVVVGALVMSAVALGGSASAAPPANDDIGGAVVINEPLPFSSTQSTLEATTSADETALQASVGRLRSSMRSGSLLRQPKMRSLPWMCRRRTTAQAS